MATALKPSEASYTLSDLIAYIDIVRLHHAAGSNPLPTDPTRPTSDSLAGWPANQGPRTVRRRWWRTWPGCTSCAGAASADQACLLSLRHSSRWADPSNTHRGIHTTNINTLTASDGLTRPFPSWCRRDGRTSIYTSLIPQHRAPLQRLTKGALHELNQMVNPRVNHLVKRRRVARDPNPRLKLT